MSARSLIVAGWLLALAGCVAQPPSTSPGLAERLDAPASALPAPDWRPGDRWVYEWTSGSERGTRAIEVVESRTINGVDFYVLNTGDVQQYYTKELHFAAGVRDSKVTVRMVPPQPWFIWPLARARQWSYRGVYEDRDARHSRDDKFAVVATETVTVPAGEFRTIKIVRETARREFDQYWYAPAVRWYVRWVGRRGDTEFDEQLQEYRAAPRLISADAPR
jgi:hypothetical protein